MSKLILIIFGILTSPMFLVIPSYGVTTEATSSGNWNNSGTWDNGVPECGDYVIIPSGITVTVTDHVELDETSAPACSTVTNVEVGGILKFNTGKKLHLACGSNVYVLAGGSVQKGSGGGNSNIIEVCQTTYWNAGDGNLSGPATIGPGPGLPIELAFFNAEVKTDHVRLNWKTLSEINNDYFTIERSADLLNIENISEIEGAGNSFKEIEYDFFDQDPLHGISYYRLKQTDFNGTFEHSDWVAVRFGNSSQKNITLFRQAMSNILTVEVDNHKGDKVEMLIHDISGRELQKISFIPTSDVYVKTLDITFNDFIGVLLCTIKVGNEVYTFKVGL